MVLSLHVEQEDMAFNPTHRKHLAFRLRLLCIALLMGISSTGNAQRNLHSKHLLSEQDFTSAMVTGVWNLKLTEGEMPKWLKDKEPHYPHHYEYRLAMHPYVIMDNGEYAMVRVDGLHNDAFILAVALMKPPIESIRGTLVVPDANYQKMVKLRFEIPPTEFGSDLRKSSSEKLADFHDFIRSHYQGSQIKMSLYSTPGASWFRMQSNLRINHALAPRTGTVEPTEFAYHFLDKSSSFHESFDVGALRKKTEEQQLRVDLETLPKPSVRKIDCKVDVPKAPKADSLASSIPADQWAVFFPSTQEASASFERLRSECSRFHWTVDSGGVYRSKILAADSPAFYEQQLLIDSKILLQELTSPLATSVAITGSDLAFYMGTDIALLIESKDVVKLDALLRAHRERITKKIGPCQTSEGEQDGIRYQLIQNQDRSISSFLAVLGSRVVITNSLVQLKRLAQVQSSEQGSIRNDELYKWLRHSYPLESKEESGLLVVTEPFVRRLASARWRIAAARRWVAAAFQKELQARYVARHLLDKPFDLEEQESNLGISQNQHFVVGDQIQHKTFGSNAFYAPVIELPMSDVTESEAKAYRDWLSGYEQLNSRLDPMGVQFKNSSNQFFADISLFPKTQDVNYFSLDIYLGRQTTVQSLRQILFSNEDTPRILTWRNLFVLNELRRQFPKQDPVETFKQLTGRTIPSVPGGHYRWNEQWQSMECSVLGCPGDSVSKLDQVTVWGKVKDVRLDESVEKNCNRINVSVDFEIPFDGQ